MMVRGRLDGGKMVAIFFVDCFCYPTYYTFDTHKLLVLVHIPNSQYMFFVPTTPPLSDRALRYQRRPPISNFPPGPFPIPMQTNKLPHPSTHTRLLPQARPSPATRLASRLPASQSPQKVQSQQQFLKTFPSRRLHKGYWSS